MAERADFVQSLEGFAKAAAVFFGALYVCGVFVVTLHLSVYGVFSLSLLRAQYVVAGVLFLAPAVLTLALLSVAYIQVEEVAIRDRGETSLLGWGRLKVALRVLWRLAVALVLINALVDGIVLWSSNSEGLMWTHRWTILKSSLFILVIAQTFRAARSRVLVLVNDPQSREGWKALRPVAVCCIFFFFFLIYAEYFALGIYPLIPYEYGGGRPLSVAFLLKRGEKKEEYPVTADSSGNRSIPYKLLMETQDTYIVVSPSDKERAIELDRKAVEGFVVLKEASQTRTQ